MNKKYLLALLLSSLSISVAEAQYKEFGNVVPEDFKSYPSKYDSTESAVVLFENGYSYFSYPDFELFFERHVRLKILNDQGVDEADVSLVFNRDLDQGIERIKAASYALEDGQLKKTELDKGQIFEEKLTGNIRAKKFVIPGTSKGSIIEYSYKERIGNAFLMPDWEFHKDIPVMFSQYKMKVPNNFHYQTVVKGIDTTLVRKIDKYGDYSGRGVEITLSKSNLPPVKDIPFINAVDDFKTEIFNQLVYVSFRGSPSQTFNNSWDKVAKELRDHPAIGKQRLNGAMKDAVKEVINGIEDPLERAKAIYSFVANKIAWNGYHYLISKQGIRDTFKNEKGNSADINLMLHEMLKFAGIKADYAFISTKENGKIITNYPIIHQFNHIVVIIEIDEMLYLLDATEGYRALKMPPEKDLFRYVFRVNDNSFSWLNSAPGIRTTSNTIINKDYYDDGTVDFEVSGNVSGYYAERIRALKESDMVWFLSPDYELQIDSTDVSNLDDVEEDFKFNIYGEFIDQSVKEGHDIVYLNPFSIMDSQKNPFTANERDFPVYFPFRFKQRIVVNVNIPKTYEIEELPSPNSFIIGENRARIRFLTQDSQNKLTMMIDFSVNDIQFGTDVYQAIRELYSILEESKKQRVILKRISN